jgi:hypothetical protein
MRSRCCLCVCVRVSSLSLLSTGSVKMPLSLLSNGLVKNPLIVARQRLGENLPIVARQRLGRNVTAVINTDATTEELLDASFSMRPVSCQEKQAISSSQNSLFDSGEVSVNPESFSHSVRELTGKFQDNTLK